MIDQVYDKALAQWIHNKYPNAYPDVDLIRNFDWEYELGSEYEAPFMYLSFFYDRRAEYINLDFTPIMFVREVGEIAVQLKAQIDENLKKMQEEVDRQVKEFKKKEKKKNE